MPFSITCKLLLMFVTVLCFLLDEKLNFYEIFPSCCMTASKAHIKKPVIQCYEQKEDSFPNCKIHSFISPKLNCIASWLPERLQRLKNVRH
uniref:Chemokine interleukin-8-like domain-containing protein n=1 Tax=Mastacembelus armatus TaxID=205130 RepID=A0A7N8XCV7_9TELE